MNKKLKNKSTEDISSFALIDIKRGKDKLYELVKSGHIIPVTVTGYIQSGTQPHGNDDGTSREFAMLVEEIHVGGPILGPPADKFGRLWALVDSVKIGDRIQVDDGFEGLKRGATRTVMGDHQGLFINTKAGRHYLDGQIGERGELIGIYPTT